MKKLKCPDCGKQHIIKNGYYVTRQGQKPRVKCQDCGRNFPAPVQKGVSQREAEDR